MISVFVYFKTARQARAQVSELCPQLAQARSHAHQCQVSISLRADEQPATADTWLEHYLCPSKQLAESLLLSLRESPLEPALLSLIIDGAAGRHLEIFEELPGYVHKPCA